MLVELWKEIEMEYINSKIHSMVPVTISDQNVEKRGEGRRMTFQCQGRICVKTLFRFHSLNILSVCLLPAGTLYKSQNVSEDHVVFATCMQNGIEIEFVALVTQLKYSSRRGESALRVSRVLRCSLRSTSLSGLELLSVSKRLLTLTCRHINQIFVEIFVPKPPLSLLIDISRNLNGFKE